ncbi:unnamed protein product [Fraxinus pennsylvanica]|uniref:Uncharacterized protein n=1 Tax=Fraxinus pennsylvanica TaxID=56036 RepID=A0AAD1ZVF4_9LAMI|nr:unnamed protein product [Fraxinus pennsylvanica]
MHSSDIALHVFVEMCDLHPNVGDGLGVSIDLPITLDAMIIYYTDRFGMFWQCNAKAISSGSEGADSSLQEQYNKDLTLKEAETIALSTLKPRFIWLLSVKTLIEILTTSLQDLSTIALLLLSLSIIELHENKLIGEVPKDIGLLSNLNQLILHTPTA